MSVRGEGNRTWRSPTALHHYARRMRNRQLLVVGEAIVEIMRPRPDLPLDETSDFLGPYPSGAPAIFASVAARQGTPTKLCATVGRDPFGEALLDRLRRDGVDTRGVKVVETTATGVAFVSYKRNGSRRFVFHPGAASHLDEADLGEAPERAQWLHISGSSLAFGEDLAVAVMQAAERVRSAGGTIGFDPNVRSGAASPTMLQRLHRLASLADFLFPSTGELESLDLNSRPLLERGAIICTTLGRDGVDVAKTGSIRRVPAPEIEEVDPTGAGDAFAAGFTAATLGGADPMEAARVGCGVAAHNVKVFGPMGAETDETKSYPGPTSS